MRCPTRIKRAKTAVAAFNRTERQHRYPQQFTPIIVASASFLHHPSEEANSTRVNQMPCELYIQSEQPQRSFSPLSLSLNECLTTLNTNISIQSMKTDLSLGLSSLQPTQLSRGNVMAFGASKSETVAQIANVQKKTSIILVTPSFWKKKSFMLRRPLHGKRRFRLMLELEKISNENHELHPMLDFTFIVIERDDPTDAYGFYRTHYPLLMNCVPALKDKEKESETKLPFASRKKVFLDVKKEILDPFI